MREIAEEILLKQEMDEIKNRKPAAYGDLASNIHELRVHQIELEMQNEELLRLQLEADVQRARYFDLYDLAPVALLTLSDIGIIRAANHTAESLLGLSGSEIINQSIAQVIYQEDYANFRAHRKILFETGVSQTFELRFIKLNSEIIWVQVVAALMIGENTPVGWIALNDITKRKEAENQMLIAKQEIEFARVMRLQMNELQSQLKPHFIFNALSAVIALCYTDGTKAADLLTLFSRYLRLIFNVEDYEAGVSVKKTVDLVEVYAALEKSRFGDKLKVIIEVDSTLLNLNMIPLVVQPLVENAIRHGVSKKTEGGTVRLRIKRLKDNIEILICDDGVGMPSERVKTLLHDGESPVGIGISNINQRVLGQSGKPIKVRSAQGKGTLVRVLLPLMRKH
jgi:PAS domain S-box-containing protein